MVPHGPVGIGISLDPLLALLFFEWGLHLFNVYVTPQKYPRIFIIKIIIYSGYNWANLGIIIIIIIIIIILEFLDEY